MTLNATSLAAAVGAGVKNVQFKPAADNLPHKIVVIGTYDPAKTVVDEVPVQMLSPEDGGYRYGFGFMIHRLLEQVFAGSNGVEAWVIPQAEISGAVPAEGTCTVTASSALAGLLALYIAGIYVPVVVTDAMTAAQVAAAIASAVTANPKLPVTAAAVDAVVTFTSKSAGPWGNFITLKANIKAGDVYPSGVSLVFVAMASGSGTPDIGPALDALGTDNDANESWFTELVHGYGQVTAVWDDISNYVGAGNDFLGLYDKLVARPFRSLTGDTVAGSSGLNALTAATANRKLDRANGIIAAPGSANHPSEIAAQALGHMARINNDRAAQHYIGIPLIDIDPGARADRWTNDYDNRDAAVKAGVSPTRAQNGVLVLQNVISFYRPDNIPVSSNGYRSMRNISILQNLLYNIRRNFEQEKWQGISIVADVARVGSATDRQKARDLDAVIDDLIALAKAFENRAWIYTADYTIGKLKEAGAVSIRSGTTGFDSVLSVILSGEGAILDTLVEFDTSIAALG